MKTLRAVFCLTAFTACVDQPVEPPTTQATDNIATEASASQFAAFQSSSVCSTGRIHCYTHRATENAGLTPAGSLPAIHAAQIQSAYSIDPTIDPHATVAIVDAFGYQNLESDLAQYRSSNNLPACTVANGCLKIVNQQGDTNNLPQDPSSQDDWTVETALDVDMVSAACPKCKILVVQADDDQGDGLLIANNTAAQLGATVISNSWGGPESSFSPLTDAETYFNHAGIAIFVAAGDAGYTGTQPDYPSSSAYTIGVGGTTLTGSAGNWTEKAWTYGGSSCSKSIAKPSWQTSSACAKRATSDVSAVADQQIYVYNANAGGSFAVAGTSAASPLVAAIYALSGHGNATAQLAYANPTAFNDVTTGNNKAQNTCSTAMCTAGAGWDGPTGVGTPNAAKLALVSGGNGSGSGSGNGSGSGMGSGSGSGSNTGSGSGSNEGSDGSNNGGNTGSGSGSNNGNGDNNGGNGNSSGGGGCAAGGTGAGLGSGLLVVGLALAGRRRRR